MCVTGFRGKYLVTGYPNGDITLFSRKKTPLGSLVNAHKHLIRTMFSFKRLNDAYFCSVDVCGMIKIWQSAPTPIELMHINLDSGVAYNSSIELQKLPIKGGVLSEMGCVAVALKSNKVYVIFIDPVEKIHKVFLSFETSDKACSMVELNS